jgi:hypothetical protein
MRQSTAKNRSRVLILRKRASQFAENAKNQSMRHGERKLSASVIRLEVMVPGGGIEPPQAFWALRILSPLRLPISPSRRCLEVIDCTSIIDCHSHCSLVHEMRKCVSKFVGFLAFSLNSAVLGCLEREKSQADVEE